MSKELGERIKCIKQGKLLEGYKIEKNRIIPKNWNFESISNLVEKIKKSVKVDPKCEYRQIGIRSHGKGIFYKDVVTGEELGKKAVFWIEPDCFIVNIVFAWEMAIGKTTNKEIGMIASHRFPMYKPKRNKLDLDFMTYFFKSPWGNNLLELASPGGAGRNKTLGQNEFLKLKIPVPSLSEQKKITDILSTWDKAIELKEQLIEEKKQQKKGLMKKLLTCEVRLPGFDGEWKVVKLGEISEIKTGDKDSQDKVEKGKYPFFVRSENIEKIDSYSFDGEAILIPGDGKIGEIYHYLIGKFDFHQRVYKISDFIENISGRYVYFYLKYFFKKQAMKYTAKATVDSLRMPVLLEMEINIPCLREQQRIAKILSTMEQQLELLEQELAALKLQKKGLMQLLLTGIVRVPC